MTPPDQDATLHPEREVKPPSSTDRAHLKRETDPACARRPAAVLTPHDRARQRLGDLAARLAHTLPEDQIEDMVRLLDLVDLGQIQPRAAHEMLLALPDAAQ